MSSLIEFLANVGSSASFNRIASGDYVAQVSNAGLKVEESRALLDCDVRELTRIVGGRAEMVCMIIAPEEESGDGEDTDDCGAALASSVN